MPECAKCKSKVTGNDGHIIHVKGCEFDDKVKLTPIQWSWECLECGENNETDINYDQVQCEYCASEFEIE